MMKLEHKAEFSRLLTGLAELYGKSISKCLFEIYWYALEKYSLEEIKRAIHQHIHNPDGGQFMPKPADFVGYLEGKNEEKALLAWEKVISAIRRVGAYESMIFDDPLIHGVINKMGGWVRLCQSLESQLPFLFQEFSRRYHRYLIHSQSEYPKKLKGITEHVSRLSGNSIDKAPCCQEKNDYLSI